MPLNYDDEAPGLASVEKPKKRIAFSGNIDAFLETEGATHLKPVVEAIYGQESGSGRTHATSIDGARGQMQVIPATFKRLAKPGEDINNPDDNMRVGVRYIKLLGDKFGNDPAKIATGYFSGEGNVNTTGDTPYKFDHADGNKKTVSSYVKDVLGRVGGAIVPSAQAAEAPAAKKDGLGYPTWGEVTAKSEYQALKPEEQDTARRQYFMDNVVPQLSPEQVKDVWAQFDAETKPVETSVTDKVKKAVGWNEGRAFKAPEGVTDDTFSAGVPEDQAEQKRPNSVMAGYETDTQAPSKNIAPMTESGEAKVRGMLKDQPDEKLFARLEQGGVVGQVAEKMLVERGVYRGKLANNQVPSTTEDAQAGVNPKRWNHDRAADANREYLQRNKAAVMEYLTGAQRLAPQDAAIEYDRMLQQGVVPNQTGLENTRPEAGYGDVLSVGATRAKAGLGRGYMGLGEWVGDAFGIDAVSKFSSAAASGYEQDLKTAADDVMGKIPQEGFKALVAETAPSIITQVPGILAAGLATAITKNPAALEGILSAALLTPMGAQVFGETYREGKNAGLSLADNTAYSAGKALAEVLPERLSLGAMFKFLGGVNKGSAVQIATSFLGQQATEHTTEQITTVAQFLLDKAYANPELSLKELESQMVQTFKATALQAPILAAVGGGAVVTGKAGLALRDKLDPKGAAFRQLESNIEGAQFAGVDKEVRDSLNPNVTDSTVAVPEATGFAPERPPAQTAAVTAGVDQPEAPAAAPATEDPLGQGPLTSPIADELAGIEGVAPTEAGAAPQEQVPTEAGAAPQEQVPAEEETIGGRPASQHTPTSLQFLMNTHPDQFVRDQAATALLQKEAESLNADPETTDLVRRVTRDPNATAVPETALPAATGSRGEGLTRESAAVIRSIYELSGTSPVWYAAQGAEGFVLPQRSTKQVFLNARKGSITPLAVAGHEVFHNIETDSPDLAGTFRTVVDRVSNIDLSNDDGLLAYAQTYAPGVFNGKAIESMRAEGKSTGEILDALIPEIGDGYTRELVRNEFYNDVFGNRWSEPGFYKSLIKELARTDVGLLQKFKGALDMVVQKVQGMSGSNFAADQFLKDIEPVRQEAARVYAAYASRQGFREKIAKMTPAELLFTKKTNTDEVARDLAEQELKRREIEGAYAELEEQKKAEKEKFKEANKEAKLERAEAEAKAAGTDDDTPTNMKQALAAAKPDKQAIRKQLAKEMAKAAATARGKAQVRAEQLEDNEQGRFSPARETAADHKMQITREERELADKTKLTREELKRVTASAMQFGLKPRVVEMEVRRIKARFPEAAGWAPLEFNRVDPKTMAKKARPGNPLPSDAIFFVEQGYKFHLGPKETQAARITQLASALAGEITAKYVAAQNGDPVAKVIMRQSDWYQALRGKLRATFGGFGDFLAQLLGPTSASNPVEPNFKYGIEALKLATSGKWDNLFKDIFAWRADIDAAAAALDATIATVQAEGGKGVMKDPRVVAAMAELKKASVYKGESPRRENGKQFGMASKGIEQILAEKWGDKVRGDAPKTKNYYQNIMGRTLEATIDVWAARTLRRLANEAIGDFPRIPPVAETAVAGNVLADNVTSGSEFGFGQDVFREAAAQLRNSGIEQFKNTTPDAVQAMIWFAEKELWARRDWTTKVGEEGSIEHEMLLAGYPDRKQLDAWRVAARSGHPNPETQAFQGKDGKLRVAKFEKAVAKWKEAKALAADALSKIEKYPDRFVAGATTEIPGDKPTDKEMAKVARELEAAIADEKVMAVRAVSSTGEFMGDFERTLDTEFVVRNGYDATPVWNKLVEIGEREGQQAVFLSRVLREDEKPNFLLHRPGVELYFTKPISLEDAKPLMDAINAAGVHGMTMATEGRRTPGALEGKDQPIAGIRMQHIPEFMLGYGYNVSMTDAEITASITAARDKMEDLVEQLSTRGDVATAKAHWYETRVHFYGNQDAKAVAGREPGTGAGEVWSGQRISEALKGADRFARDGEAPLAARRAELRQLSRGRAAEGSSGQDVRRSPNRDDLGSLRAPGYGTGQKGSVSKLGVHYSKAERSSLSGAHYGQGMKGAEKERLLRESGAPGQQHRIHYYVDEGQGIRPESDVGDHAHATQLNNLYDWNDDPLNLWPAARARYQDPADRFNHVEQQIIARGFDGVYAAEAQGSQGVAVLLGTKHKSVPVQHLGRGYRGGKTAEQAPATKAEPKRTDLPMGKMTGAEWKKLEPRATELEDGKSYYRSDIRFSPARLSPEAEKEIAAIKGRLTKIADSSRAVVETNLANVKRGLAGEIVRDADGNLLAPNGRKSNLTEAQYLQVRTPAFKAWFGDWLAHHNAQDGNGVWATDEVSKVVDANGEPRVVYHGSEKGGFTVMQPEKGDKHRSPMLFAAATRQTARTYSWSNSEIDLSIPEFAGTEARKIGKDWFVVQKAGDPSLAYDVYGELVDIDQAEGYVSKKEAEYFRDHDLEEFLRINGDVQQGIYSIFLNIRNPQESDFEGANWDGNTKGLFEVLGEDGDNIYADDGRRLMPEDEAEALAEANKGAEVNSIDWIGETTNTVAEEAKKYGLDGAIIRSVEDDGGRYPGGISGPDDVFVFFDSNQAKSATQNTGAFSKKNDDLRYSPARFDAIAEAFAKRAGAALANPRNAQSVLIHNSTPASMQILGWSNRRLLVEASELAKIANKPGFETDDKIGDLVRDLGRPGAMFWNDKQGSLNILRRADMRGAPALIAIRPDVKTGTTARDHLLVTAHRLDSQDALLRKIVSGELKPLYLDQANPVIKEAMQKKKYQVVVGESLAQENLHARTDKKLGTASRLLSPDDLVKWETENWGDSPKFSPPRFYSQLQRAFEQAPDRVFGPAAQVKAWLASNAGKMGVKQDEINWSGINDWLDLQGKQKVSKDQVVQYLQQNGVQVTEVEKGKAGFDEDDPRLPEDSPLEVMESDEEYHGEMARRYKYVVIDTEADTTKGFGHTRQEAISDAHSDHPSYWDREGSTKYHGYTLPGGESYRELLLTLPRREAEFTIPSDVKIKYEGEGSFAAYQGGEWIGSYPTRAQATEAMEKRFGTAKDFKSSHWDEKNILAHVRFNDRTDADGKKVLFIEEVQSDWGQTGKKSGFGDKPAGWEVVRPNGQRFGRYLEKSDAESALARAPTGSRLVQSSEKMPGVPLAPFVTDTKAWAGLAVKRMVAYAAENGYDKVAFVNGQQSSDRYDLSERVKSISYATNEDGTYFVKVKGLDGKDVWSDSNATPEELEDVVGKEIVERIVRNEGHEVGAPKGSGSLSGDGLKVGSQGMAAFYDKILPQVVSDVLKKVGGGKLETVEIEGEYTADQKQQISQAYGSGTLEDVKRAKQISKPWLKQLGFSVTPAMRERVAEGLPLFSPLRKVADAINSTITRVDAAVDGLSHLPDQFDYLSDRYLALGKIARVDEIITEIRGAFDGMPQADKGAVYAYLTTRGAPLSMIGNPEGRTMAKRVKDVINYVGDALVARGLLDPASRAKYKDQYLPRLYLKHLMNDADWKMLGGGKKPTDMGYLKERKDIAPEIRELVLGEVKDPSFLAANAVGRAMRDMALLDWMGKISQHNDWVYPGVFVDYRGQRVTSYWLKAEADRIEAQIPHYTPANQAKARQLVADMRQAAGTANLDHLDHTEFKQVPDTIRYGMLRGMWLRKEIYHDIMGASQIINADPTWFEDWFGFGGKGTRLTQWWKFSKVALNPPGQVRNFVSNMVMLQLSGVGLHKLPFRLIQAAREIANNGRHWQIAKKYGVTESTFTAQELYRVKRDLLMLENGAGRMNPLAWLTNVGAHFLDKVGNLYQFSEALGKVIKIIDAMDKGKTEAEAAIEAQKWLFDYSLVPQSVRIARNSPVGMPFITYQIKVLPRLLEVLAKHPWRFLPWVGLLYGMQAYVASLFGADDDDMEKLKKSLPQWLQERGHTVFLPNKDDNGRIQVADVGYFFPWSFYSQVGKHAAEGDVKKAVLGDLGGLFSAPIIGAGAALMSNYDNFTKKPIYNEGDPKSYQAAAVANYVYDLMAPPFISSHGFASPMGFFDKQYGGKMVQALSGTTNKFGDLRATPGQAIAGLLGFNFYGMDPDHSRVMNVEQMVRKVQDAERRLKTRMVDQGLTEAQRVKYIEDYRERMLELGEEARRYAEESEVPEQLKVRK